MKLATISQDGRAFLARRPEPFDIVILDAYASETLPSHLFTREAFTVVRQRLAPEGLLMAHIVARPESTAVAALAATLWSVFDGVRLIAVGEAELTSIRCLASLGRVMDVGPLPGHELRTEQAQVLTDDRNALDVLYAADARALRVHNAHLVRNLSTGMKRVLQ